MSVAQVSYALGLQALSDPCEAVQQGVELLACGCFKRQQFLAGLRSGTQQLQPFAVVQLVGDCIQHGLLGLELLQALLADPKHACYIIQEASWSYCSSGQLLLSTLSAADKQMSPTTSASRNNCCQKAVSGVVVLLQQLLSYVLGLECADSQQQHHDLQNELHQYLSELVAHLRAAAAVDEVLATSMLCALKACSATTDATVIGRVTRQLLQKSAHSPALISQQTAAAQQLSWPVAILRHTCWYTNMSLAIELLGQQQVLQELQQHVSRAVAAPHALDHTCRMLAGVTAAAGGSAEIVMTMLSGMLLMGIKAGQVVELLAPLLVAQYLLDKCQYSQLLQMAAAALTSDTPAAGWSALLRALTLMLYGASLEALQAHVQLLQHVASAAGQYMQSKVHEVLELLQSAVVAKQQERNKRQIEEGQPVVKMNASMRSDLQQFQQSPIINGRRQLSEYQRNRWRMYRGTVQDWCSALSHNLPESAAEARIRWEFLKALEDLNLGFHNGTNLNHVIQSAIKQLCLTCDDAGLDVLGRQEAQPRQPMEQLQHLLSRLPCAAFAATQQYFTVRNLLRQIGQQIHRIMQPEATKDADVGRPFKKQCTDIQKDSAPVTPAIDSSSSDCKVPQQLVRMLLDSHDSIVLNSKGLNSAWRLEFVNMLQQVKSLHVALLQQLMTSVSGGQGDLRETSARSTAHGRLLALLAAAELSQVLILKPGCDDALEQADVAVALYSWQASIADVVNGSFNHSCSSTLPCNMSATRKPMQSTGDAADKTVSGMWKQQPELLTGFGLLDLLMSSTSVDSIRNVCHATLFWTAYAAEVGRLGSWSAGPYGPFRTAHAMSEAASSAAPQQQHQKVRMGYLPVQLLGLLRTLRHHLATAVLDVQHQADETGLWEFVQQSHKVVTIALKNCEPLRWLQQHVG